SGEVSPRRSNAQPARGNKKPKSSRLLARVRHSAVRVSCWLDSRMAQAGLTVLATVSLGTSLDFSFLFAVLFPAEIDSRRTHTAVHSSWGFYRLDPGQNPRRA